MVRKSFVRILGMDGELLKRAGPAPLLECLMRYHTNELSCRVMALRSS